MYFDPRFLHHSCENVVSLISAYAGVRAVFNSTLPLNIQLFIVTVKSFGDNFLAVSSIPVRVSIDNLCRVLKWVVTGFVSFPVFWFSCSVDEVVSYAARIRLCISIT